MRCIPFDDTVRLWTGHHWDYWKGERMRIVIEIPDTDYKFIKSTSKSTTLYPTTSYPTTLTVYEAIKNGTVIPDNPTNGDMIKMMFPTVDISTNGMFGKEGTVFVHHKDHIIIFDADWWNAPYRRDGETE